MIKVTIKQYEPVGQEDDGSDWFYKLQFICRVLQGESPDKTDMQTALGMAQSLKRERWTVEKALTPTTAADITPDQVDDTRTNYEIGLDEGRTENAAELNMLEGLAQHYRNIFYTIYEEKVNLEAKLADTKKGAERYQWQPIETAPKDESLFFGYIDAEKYVENDDGVICTDESCVEICWWQKLEHDDGYYDCGMLPLTGNVRGEITYWMPIPAAPTIQAKGKT